MKTFLYRNILPIWVVVFSLVFNATIPSHTEIGIWSTSTELANIPMSGSAWYHVKNAADKDQSNPDISGQDDSVDVFVLASAIVYARTGNTAYKNKVVNACSTLAENGKPSTENMLAWARNTGAYAMAADLVGYRTTEFEDWLLNMAEVYDVTGETMIEMYRERPNNWGTQGFGSLTAIYVYLGESAKLNDVREYFIDGVVGPNPGHIYAPEDISWHADTTNLRIINPQGAVKSGLDIDGVCPDDMRRNGSFQNPPPLVSDYHWEALQGLVVGARILSRSGLSIWNIDNDALHRAIDLLENRWATSFGNQWKADGDDTFMLPIIDEVYGSDYSSSTVDTARLWTNGKGAGWPYVTESSKYFLGVNIDGAGEVTLNPSEGVYDASTVVTLTADPNSGESFIEWSGDVSGSNSTVTVTMNSHKSVKAKFSSGMTTVELNPTDDTYVWASGKNYKNDNFNSDPRLLVYKNGGEEKLTYLKFSLSSVSGTLISARLELYCQTLNSAPATVYIYYADDSWDETTLTYNNKPAPAFLGAKYDCITGEDIVHSFCYKVTDYVAQELSGDNVITFVLKDNANTAKEVDFEPKEVGTTPPVLKIKLDGGSGPPDPPNAPSDLSATTVSSSQIDLAWTDNSSDEDGFKVERSEDGQNFSQVATTDANDTDHSDTGLSASTKYYYRVRAYNTGGNSNYSNVDSATTQQGGPVDDVTDSDIPVNGTVTGNYIDTHTSNDTYESIEEIESGGKPSGRYTYLEHKWTIDVTGGSTVTFYAEAYHTSNSEGDDFVFAYSTDNENYTNMLTVTKTSDDNNYQSYDLPSSLSGTVYIRVKDTDQSQGNRIKDIIYIDHMYINSGTAKRTIPKEVLEVTLPTKLRLYENYPNPFNQCTKIRYDLPQSFHVKLTIHDMIGRKITTLVDEVKNAGEYTQNWEAVNSNGTPLPSGVYLCRFQSDSHIETMKLMLIR